MKLKSVIYFAAGLVLVILSAWQIAMAQKGLRVIKLNTSNPPVTIITPADAKPASRPTVLIAHGFAGSAVLMRGFALTLAHAGYTTVSWDFGGHGANPNPMLSSSDSTNLLHDAESALAEAASTGLIDTQHVAILGHSMGSGVALSYGLTHADTYATIAISPVIQPVNIEQPHNLLLMAGSLEPQFVNNAESLLSQAGNEYGTLAGGNARQLAIIPNVEHISILFSPTAHSTARSWLEGTFGVQPGATNYVDRRIEWFVIGIAGFILLCVAGLNMLPMTGTTQLMNSSLWIRLTGLLAGGIGATLILWLVSLLGVNLNQLLGLLVGGYIIIWFGLAGVIALLISRPHLSRPTANNLIRGLIAFLALWLGVGLLGNFVWLPWLLIPARLQLWIPASIIIFPFFLAIGEAAKSARVGGQIGMWLVQVIVVVGGLYLAIRVNPELGFIFIILPVIPIMLGLQALAISPRHGSWAYALSGGMFTAWLLLAVFPLL